MEKRGRQWSGSARIAQTLSLARPWTLFSMRDLVILLALLFFLISTWQLKDAVVSMSVSLDAVSRATSALSDTPTRMRPLVESGVEPRLLEHHTTGGDGRYTEDVVIIDDFLPPALIGHLNQSTSNSEQSFWLSADTPVEPEKGGAPLAHVIIDWIWRKASPVPAYDVLGFEYWFNYRYPNTSHKEYGKSLTAPRPAHSTARDRTR